LSAAIDPATTTEGLPEAAGTEPQAEGTEEQSQPTLQEQVRGNADFAWEQITKRDAKISELANQAKQHEVVDPYIRAAGGPEQLLNLAAFGQQVQQVPGLEEIVQKAISDGRVVQPEPVVANDTAEEWMDEDTKRVRDESRAEIETLRQQLQELSNLTNSASVRSHETHISRNIDSVVDLFSSTDEGKEEALKLIQDRVMIAQKQAENGNETQQRMIEQLAGPEGEDVLQFMLMKEGLFKKYGAEIYGTGQTPTEDAASAAAARSTDARTTNPSRPGSPELPPLPKGRVTTDYAQGVLREIQRRRGRSV